MVQRIVVNLYNGMLTNNNNEWSLAKLSMNLPWSHEIKQGNKIWKSIYSKIPFI